MDEDAWTSDAPPELQASLQARVWENACVKLIETPCRIADQVSQEAAVDGVRGVCILSQQENQGMFIHSNQQ